MMMNSMRYNFIFYDETILNNFILNLQNNTKGKNISQFNYAYILHDSDIIIETGETKKAHWHLWIEFNSAVKSMYLEKVLELSGSSSSALSHQKTDRNFLAYLTHDTINSKLKAHYNFDDIKTNIDIDMFKEMYYNAIEKLNKPTSQEKNLSLTKTIFDIVAENKDITCFSQLCFFLRQNEEYELLEYCIKRTYGLREALKQFFGINSMKCSQVFENEKIEQIEGVSVNEHLYY